jgi:hypothetical protein
MTTTLTVEEDGTVSGRFNISGTGLDFTISTNGDRIDITGDAHLVEVNMDTVFEGRANIKWIQQEQGIVGGNLGYHSNPFGNSQVNSYTYLPPTATDYNFHANTVIDAHTDSQVYQLGNMITQCMGTGRIYGYFLYRPATSTDIYARRRDFTNSTSVDVNIGNYSGTLILYKESADDDILYILKASADNIKVVNFDDSSIDDISISLTSGATVIGQYHNNQYFYNIIRTVTGTSDYVIEYSYERVDMTTGDTDTVVLGSVTMTGNTAAEHSIITACESAKLTGGGVIFMECYQTGESDSSGEVGVIYGSDNGVAKHVFYTNPGGETVSVYDVLLRGPISGFIGNHGTNTCLLASFGFDTATVNKSVVVFLDDDLNPTYTIYDDSWPSTDVPATASGITTLCPLSTRYSENMYFAVGDNKSQTSIIIRNAIDGTTYHELTASELGYYRVVALKNHPVDDVDDSIYIAIKTTSNGHWRIAGVTPDGTLVKTISKFNLFQYDLTGLVGTETTTCNSIVTCRYAYYLSGHYYSSWMMVYIEPIDPDYGRA